MTFVISSPPHPPPPHPTSLHPFLFQLLAGTGLFDGHEGELATWLRHLQNADAAPDEAVTFFVGLLRQYVPNPYPAIDRLLEQVEESPQLIEGRYLPYVRWVQLSECWAVNGFFFFFLPVVTLLASGKLVICC